MKRLVIILSVLVALVAATPATGAKPTKPAHVQASVDFIWVGDCDERTRTGHIELDAWDDDTTPVVNLWDRQADRVTMTITMTGGDPTPALPLGTLGMTVEGTDAFIAFEQSWEWGWQIHDGGRRGTALTGEITWNGVPETVDWLRAHGSFMCGRGTFYLTSGYVKVTDDWIGATHS